MDNAQKAIMIGVALFLTILVIAVVLLITNTGLNTAKKSGDQIATMSTSLEKQLIAQYDRVSVTGQDVIDVIQQYMPQLNNNIFVETNDSWNTAYRISNSAITATMIVTPGVPPNYFAVGESGRYIKLTSLGASSQKTNLINTIDRDSTYIGHLVKDKLSLKTTGIVFLLPSSESLK